MAGKIIAYLLFNHGFIVLFISPLALSILPASSVSLTFKIS